MDFRLSCEQALLRYRVREYASTVLSPHVRALEEQGEFPGQLVSELSRLGLVGILTARTYGGSAMGHLARLIAIEEVSKVYGSSGFFLQVAPIGIYILENFGSEALKERYLPSLCDGEMLIAIALTESRGGCDMGAIRTTADVNGDEYILNGRKTMITLSPICDLAIVVARTGDGFSTFLLERGMKGFETPRRENRSGFRSIPIGNITMTNCRVPKANLIGGEGRGVAAIMSGIGAVGRLGAAGVALGLAEGCYQDAMRYAAKRELYGKPIAELQTIQNMLVDSSTDIETARWLCYYAAWLLDQGKSPRDAADEIARCKLYACDIATRVALRAIQILGGRGTIQEYGIARRLNDATELLAAAGTQEVMRNSIGRNIISRDVASHAGSPPRASGAMMLDLEPEALVRD